jgi:hypothetical protein
MTKHSVLPASSCERWWNCPGSVNACVGIPNPPNKYTAEGAVAHSIAEQWLRKGGCPGLDSTIMQDGFEIEVTSDMLEAVEEYVEYVRQHIPKGAVVRYEEKVELKEVHAVMFGTADTVVVEPFKCVHIFDLKFGQGKRVSAWKNKQLMYYALGVALKEDVPRFVIHICQPRVDEGFTKYEGTIQELKDFELELKCKAETALFKDAPLVAGDWCKQTFCPNRVNCPALAGLARELVVKDFDSVPVVDVLTVEQIQKVLKYEDTVKDWMARVRDHAAELMLQGVDIPGWKVVESLGHAQWVDAAVIEAEFGGEFGDKLYTKKLVSPAQFEKVAGKKRLGPNFREDYTVRPKAGYKVVEENEKGENVKLTKAEEDFK